MREGKRLSAETRKKMREAKLGKSWRSHSAESIRKISEAQLGISKTAEVRENMSSGQKKRYEDPKERARTGKASSKALKGKPLSAEHCKAISEAKLGSNPDHPEGGPVYFGRLSRDIWELVHQEKIPKGFHIHHIDGNWKNIDPENLELRSPSGHRRWHAAIKKIIDKVEALISV